MPFPQSPVLSTYYPSSCLYAVFWCYKVGLEAFNCIRLTSPSLTKGGFKRVSLLAGKPCTDANQRIAGGVWSKVGVIWDCC